MWEQIKAQFQELLAGFVLENVLTAVVVAVICLIIIKVLLVIYDSIMAKSKLEKTVASLLRVAVKILLLFVAVIIVMTCLNIPVTSLVAVLSVVGLALSLAVQNFLGNVAGGLQVIATKPFKVGDYVEANGCSGTVLEIGLFHTKLHTSDNKDIYMPNSGVVSANITNYSSEELRRVDITVGAPYDHDTELVKKILLQLIQEHPLTLSGGGRDPVTHVSQYRDNDIQYIMRAWCTGGDYWTVYYDLMDAIKPVFEQNGITMSYPHVNVHMIEK